MGLRDGKVPGSRVLFWGGLVITLLMHGGLVVIILIGRSRAEAAQARGPVFGTVVDVQAVKFGKPRDMSFLPHKEAPPPPHQAPKLQLSNNLDAKPLPKLPNQKEEPPRPDDDPLKHTHAKQFENLADPANTGSATEEGDPNGQKGGTALVGKGPIYFQHLQAAVQNAWNIPTTLSDAQLAHLKAQACLKIDSEGKITEYKISLPSGNNRYDNTLLDALASIKQFDAPTNEPIAPGGPTVKDVVTGEGVCMNFQKDRTP